MLVASQSTCAWLCSCVVCLVKAQLIRPPEEAYGDQETSGPGDLHCILVVSQRLHECIALISQRKAGGSLSSLGKSGLGILHCDLVVTEQLPTRQNLRKLVLMREHHQTVMCKTSLWTTLRLTSQVYEVRHTQYVMHYMTCKRYVRVLMIEEQCKSWNALKANADTQYVTRKCFDVSISEIKRLLVYSSCRTPQHVKRATDPWHTTQIMLTNSYDLGAEQFLIKQMTTSDDWKLITF